MDSAVHAMFLALAQGEVEGMDGTVAFLRARPHENLHQFAGRLTCEQTWKPLADALAVSGFPSSPTLLEGEAQFDLVLLRPERQRDQVLYDMARGFRLLRPGGTLLVSLPNDWGAARHEKHLKELAGEVRTLSKHHCRAFWAVKTPSASQELLEAWLEGGKARPLAEDPRFLTSPGVFSWNEIDPGSRMLAENLPPGLLGRVADLGAGWGYLSRYILEHRPLVQALHLYEADAVALALARQNLAPLIRKEEGAPSVAFEWTDVTEGLGFASFDAVVMNPPFHQGREADPLLGHKFMAAAIGALRPGGQLWMVANQFLPYERFLADALPNARVITQGGGYKVLHGTRAKAEDSPGNGAGRRQRHRDKHRLMRR
jgi:16S rRNA (guanine1207-N2)-methyltransferase